MPAILIEICCSFFLSISKYRQGEVFNYDTTVSLQILSISSVIILLGPSLSCCHRRGKTHKLLFVSSTSTAHTWNAEISHVDQIYVSVVFGLDMIMFETTLKYGCSQRDINVNAEAVWTLNITPPPNFRTNKYYPKIPTLGTWLLNIRRRHYQLQCSSTSLTK